PVDAVAAMGICVRKGACDGQGSRGGALPTHDYIARRFRMNRDCLTRVVCRATRILLPVAVVRDRRGALVWRDRMPREEPLTFRHVESRKQLVSRGIPRRCDRCFFVVPDGFSSAAVWTGVCLVGRYAEIIGNVPRRDGGVACGLC